MSLPVSVLHCGSSRKLLGLNFIRQHPAEQIRHDSSWLRLFSSAADGSAALCDGEEKVLLEEGEAAPLAPEIALTDRRGKLF